MTKSRDELENIGSLITIKGTDACLGDLMHFDSHGTFDPALGRVDVTKEEADAHNQALDKAMLEGLDANCAVGQGSYAYLHGKEVRSFIGTVISTDVTITGRSIVFRRKGKAFRGRLSKEHDSFNYRRIS